MRLDLHVHTEVSRDCRTHLRDIPAQMLRSGTVMITWNRAAAAWVQARGLPMCAGSDAHTLQDIGEAWVKTPFRLVRSPTNLRQALAEGTVAGHWTHPVYAYGRKRWRTLHGCMDRPPNEWKKSQGAVRRDLIH